MITINFDIILMCNYKCRYCFQRHGKLWNGISSLSLMNYIINGLKYIEDDVHFTIIGGEPSLHPKLYWFVNEIQKIDCIKEIELYTNNQKELKNLPRNCILTVSYHESQIKNLELWYSNLKRSAKMVNKLNLIIMTEQSTHNIEKLYKEVKDISNIHISVNNVIDFETNTFDVVNPLSKYNVQLNAPQKITDNYKCRIKSFDIYVNGEISASCKQINQKIVSDKTLYEVINKYKNTTITCPEKICMGL